MYSDKNEPVGWLPKRMRAMPKLAWSAGSQGLGRGQHIDAWPHAAGRDAESMLRSMALREAGLFGLADLPPVAR